MNCFHKSGNVFDPFAIKVCERKSEKPVGHLPRETSRVSKFAIEHGATADAELTSGHYRRSPLVRDELEIKLKVTFKVPNATTRQVTERYRAFVEELYVEPKKKEILGSFVLVNDSESMDEEFIILQRSFNPF